MTVHLLDADVLIALTLTDHEHHGPASDWLAQTDSFAVCPVVEGALARFVLRLGESAGTTSALLRAVRDHPRCEFWPDDLSYGDLDLGDVRGHRQVTDVYLAGLAATHGGRLATFDAALHDLRPDAVTLLATGGRVGA